MEYLSSNTIEGNNKYKRHQVRDTFSDVYTYISWYVFTQTLILNVKLAGAREIAHIAVLHR
jgi:hypothetical protein